jgi:signal transduction histidine kinase
MATDATVVSRQEDLLRVAVPLYPEPVRGVPRPRDRPGPFFAVAVRQTDTNAAEAVGEVRQALLTAAGVSLAVAVLLGLVLSSTLTRRLQRLRQSAVRISREGMDAPAPHDLARDEVGDLARALAAMQSALRRQERARRAFVSTASHELRTPITSLAGTLELLGEDLADGHLDQEDARRQVATARGELGRLRNLATELLDLSRLDAGVELRSEPVELGEVARAVAAEFALEDRARGGGLQFVPPRGPCWAKGDPDAVARVARILIDNALRYSPPGTPIHVAAIYDGAHATLVVADQGPGIPESEREEVFERFRRGRAARGGGGFGLGLAIGRELAERLGGRLTLESAPHGARFVLRLPIELPAGSHATPPEPAAAT